MKEKGLILKKYEMDYSFIIKNYLNPKLWEKTWTLFTYKEFVVTLKLKSINCTNNSIRFQIVLKDYNPERKYRYDWGWDDDKETYTEVEFSLKIEDINFLQRKIQSSIYGLIETLEKRNIRSFDEYRELEDSKDEEQNTLRKIAEDFLDDNNVTNEDIREVYIDNFIDNNSKINNKLIDIIDNYKFKVFTDFYLVFANSTKDEKLIEIANKNTSQVSNIEEIQKEIKEYLEYMETEEFIDEMYENLEEI